VSGGEADVVLREHVYVQPVHCGESQAYDGVMPRAALRDF
jgi:hypothetical protein